MTEFLEFLFNGIALGGIYALISRSESCVASPGSRCSPS
jgi:hypothetical protein